MFHSTRPLLAGLAALFALVSSASGGIVSFTGSSTLLPAGNWTLGNGTLESDSATYVWNEVQQFSLVAPLPVDFLVTPAVYGTTLTHPATSPGGLLTPGTYNSHFINSDKVGESSAIVDYTGSVTFDGPIVALLVQKGTNAGAAFLEYPPVVSYDYHPYDSGDTFTVTDSGFTLEFLHRLNTAWDQVRVITVVPEPATLLGIAALGFILLSVRRPISGLFRRDS